MTWALVTGTAVWKKATREEFAPFGMTYTLRRAEGTWRIVVATIYRIHSSRDHRASQQHR
jgi:hypothetical protein